MNANVNILSSCCACVCMSSWADKYNWARAKEKFVLLFIVPFCSPHMCKYLAKALIFTKCFRFCIARAMRALIYIISILLLCSKENAPFSISWSTDLLVQNVKLVYPVCSLLSAIVSAKARKRAKQECCFSELFYIRIGLTLIQESLTRWNLNWL